MEINSLKECLLIRLLFVCPLCWDRPAVSRSPASFQSRSEAFWVQAALVKVAFAGVSQCLHIARAEAPLALWRWDDAPPSALWPSASLAAPAPPARPFAQPCGHSSGSASPCERAPSAAGSASPLQPGGPAACGLAPPPRKARPAPRSTSAGERDSGGVS